MSCLPAGLALSRPLEPAEEEAGYLGGPWAVFVEGAAGGSGPSCCAWGQVGASRVAVKKMKH